MNFGANVSIAPVPGYFAAMKRICKKHGALLILDEIMCGMGRTGTFFAWETENVVPDIMTCGKGLGGGYIPLSAVLVQDHIIQTISKGSGAFVHGHTFQAHPVACAGALAVQSIVKRDNLIERCSRKGVELQKLLEQKLGREKHVGDIRGRGMFWGIEFVADKQSKEAFPATWNFGPSVQAAAFQMGVNIYPGHGTIDGVNGDHIIIAPPYTIRDNEIQIIVETVLKAYQKVVSDKYSISE